MGALIEVVSVKCQVHCLVLLNVLAFSSPLEAQGLAGYRMTALLSCVEHSESHAYPMQLQTGSHGSFQPLPGSVLYLCL